MFETLLTIKNHPHSKKSFFILNRCNFLIFHLRIYHDRRSEEVKKRFLDFIASSMPMHTLLRSKKGVRKIVIGYFFQYWKLWLQITTPGGKFHGMAHGFRILTKKVKVKAWKCIKVMLFTTTFGEIFLVLDFCKLFWHLRSWIFLSNDYWNFICSIKSNFLNKLKVP